MKAHFTNPWFVRIHWKCFHPSFHQIPVQILHGFLHVPRKHPGINPFVRTLKIRNPGYREAPHVWGQQLKRKVFHNVTLILQKYLQQKRHSWEYQAHGAILRTFQSNGCCRQGLEQNATMAQVCPLVSGEPVGAKLLLRALGGRVEQLQGISVLQQRQCHFV